MQKLSTPEDDYDRMMENLWTNHGSRIHDYDTFIIAYDDYFDVEAVPKLDKRKLKNKIWDIMMDSYGDRFNDKLFKRAGGDDWERDRSRLAKKIVVTREEYLKLGARNVDLAGYDTPKGYVFLGRQFSKAVNRRRVVYARVIDTKKGKRFIDRRGRYVAIKTVSSQANNRRNKK